ncbi:hypothetical protein [Dactylosporangium sp. NPDC000521]|uniref:hypothetical protein n=1 Tax=Dactylosporangium sp. NPDC000521 TaxID=3363975 RepID=UPI0036905DDE
MASQSLTTVVLLLWLACCAVVLVAAVMAARRLPNLDRRLISNWQLIVDLATAARRRIQQRRRRAVDTSDLTASSHAPRHLASSDPRWRPAHRETSPRHVGQHTQATQLVHPRYIGRCPVTTSAAAQ